MHRQLLQPSQLDIFNSRLLTKYGHIEDHPNFRVVWSESQMEKRWTEYTDEGIALLYPEVRELPKYRQYIQEKYLLERLTAVPEIGEKGLTSKLTYECIWVFEGRKGEYVLPTWPAIEFILENLFEGMRQSGVIRDPDADPKEAMERKRDRILKLEKELFGNETEVTDALAHKSAIIVPGGNSNVS